jgi:tetratricopeptide (TPR) repeat protein
MSRFNLQLVPAGALGRQLGRFIPLSGPLVVLGLALSPFYPSWAAAPDVFAPNPLEQKQPDPLLPQGELSESQRSALSNRLDELNAQAGERLKNGDAIGAFGLWNRELRLRRALGPVAETQALGRVGGTAWAQNDTNQVRIITARLGQIQAASAQHSTAAPNRTALLTALASAYQQVRAPKLQLSVLDQQLADARQQRDPVAEFNVMNQIGQLHLDWFGYTNAAKTYETLLATAQQQGDAQNQIAYLYQLAYIHEQARQPDRAIPVLAELIPRYAQLPDPKLLAALKLRLANHYAATNQIDAAEAAYQDTFTTAQTALQLGYAAESLRQLGQLYRRADRAEAALQVYDFLTTFDQEQLYDLYQAMYAYDQIGQIHLGQKAYPQALAAFQQALALAQQMASPQDYLLAQIAKVNAASQGQPIPADPLVPRPGTPAAPTLPMVSTAKPPTAPTELPTGSPFGSPTGIPTGLPTVPTELPSGLPPIAAPAKLPN